MENNTPSHSEKHRQYSQQPHLQRPQVEVWHGKTDSSNSGASFVWSPGIINVAAMIGIVPVIHAPLWQSHSNLLGSHKVASDIIHQHVVHILF